MRAFWRALPALVIVAAFVTGCGGGGEKEGTEMTSQGAPETVIDVNKQYFATIELEKGGSIRIELFPQDAPQTVNNFVYLARRGYYDGVTFHRVIPGFVAQAGDPTGTGTGGPGWTIPDEVNQHKHGEGAVAMAKTARPNSAGSQFYITLAPQPMLDGTYTVFGQVVEGMDVVRSITPRDPQRNPSAPEGDRIRTITIEER
ncbi:MAG TPA: peptidylprolyl isomerase [Dehalococcoidia bacterium]